MLTEITGKPELIRDVAGELETLLAKESVDGLAEVAEELGEIVASGCELAIESYRAFLRDLKTFNP